MKKTTVYSCGKGMLMFMLSFAQTALPANNKTPFLMNEMKAQIIFSGQPFEGDQPANPTKQEFKALDEIYGRAVFTQPLKTLLAGNYSGGILDEGGALIAFELQSQGGTSTHSGVTKKLSAADLEKNYIDFDIAPSVNRSRDVFFINFGDAVSERNDAFEKRSKTQFTLSVFFLDGAHDKIPEQEIRGSFILDYSKLGTGDNGISSLSEWSRMINQAADEEQVKANIKKNSQKPSIVFSKLPFSDPAHTTVSSVKAGEYMYGRINLSKPLKEYVTEGQTPTMIHLDIKCLNGDVHGLSVDKLLRKSEFSNNYIDFDIYPSLDNAKDEYSSNLGFYFTFFATGINPQKPLLYEVSLSTDYNTNYNGFNPMEGFGEIEIDYTGVSNAKIEELNAKARKAGEEAEKNADKIAAKEGAELVKSLPMPTVFTRASKAGYSGYSNAIITQMIKQKFNATEVHMLTFDVADGSGDFTSLTDLNNYPTEKLGNHVFYFVFKDSDGLYKFSGARLRKLYEGNGVYGEAYIFPYSPIMSGDPVYPHDEIRKKNGFDSIFYFDPAKIKR